MYNEYENLSLDEQLHLSESLIIRRHNQQMYLRRNAQLLQQELSLEAELVEDNPELAQAIHSLNLQEIQAQKQGLKGVMQGDSTPKSQSIWSKLFPGLRF